MIFLELAERAEPNDDITDDDADDDADDDDDDDSTILLLYAYIIIHGCLI